MLHAPDTWWPQQTLRGQLFESLLIAALLMWAQPLQFHHQKAEEEMKQQKSLIETIVYIVLFVYRQTLGIVGQVE